MELTLGEAAKGGVEIGRGSKGRGSTFCEGSEGRGEGVKVNIGTGF